MTTSTESRAEKSQGTSSDAIYQMVARIVEYKRKSFSAEHQNQVRLLDIGCGTGNLFEFIANCVQSYEGVDILRYEQFPANLTFHKLDLDQGRAPLEDGYADFVVAVETIEHLENPRAFFRELARLCKPGGYVIVTTPNQLSMLSKMTLLLKNHFNAFADSCYPAHITALLEIDLRRIAQECNLEAIEFAYSLKGRLVMTPWMFPHFLSRWFPRNLSDNLAIVARR